MDHHNSHHTIAIIDSLDAPYVLDTSIEQRVLGPSATVKLLPVRGPDDLHGKVGSFDALISWHLIPIPGSLFPSLTKCKGIVRAAVGYDNIDLEAAFEYKIPVANVPDYGTEEVADHTMMLMLSLSRNLVSGISEVNARGWNWRSIDPVKRLRGTKLGIVGFGRIGSAVSRRAMTFGLDITFYDPYIPSGVEKAHGVKRVDSLEDLFSSSDIVTLHVPLTPKTKCFINDDSLKFLKNGGILINTSRGEVVDIESLKRALNAGNVSRVGLDVLQDEPEIPDWVINDPNIIVTPHAAFYSREALSELRERSAKIVGQFLRGEMPKELITKETEAKYVA